MKNIYAVLLISMIGINGFGQQNNDKQLSNAEQFSAKSGTLIQKVFLPIGTIKKCEIQVIEYTVEITLIVTTLKRFKLTTLKRSMLTTPKRSMLTT